MLHDRAGVSTCKGWMTHPGEKDELGKVLLTLVRRDEVVGVRIGKVETGACTPVTKKSRFDVGSFEGSGEQGVASEEDLRGGLVI